MPLYQGFFTLDFSPLTSIQPSQRDKSGERGQQAGSRLSYIRFHLGNLGL